MAMLNYQRIKSYNVGSLSYKMLIMSIMNRRYGSYKPT